MEQVNGVNGAEKDEGNGSKNDVYEKPGKPNLRIKVSHPKRLKNFMLKDEAADSLYYKDISGFVSTIIYNNFLLFDKVIGQH